MRHSLPPRRLIGAVLIAGLAGACGSGPAPATFDLSAPNQRLAGSVAGQVVVSEPVAIQTYEADRIIVKDQAGSVSFVGGGQWADRLPRLIQARLIETFENASRIRAVSRPGDRVAADYFLNTEIRAFHVAADRAEAVVELSVKVLNDKSGRIVAARVFTGRAPISAVDAGNAARALDTALSAVLLDIVRFVSSGGARA